MYLDQYLRKGPAATHMYVRNCTWIEPHIDPKRVWPCPQCNAPTEDGKSYCPEHYPRVYNVHKEKKK